ncbi:hypothetical protein [Shewanella algae]|uniref:hypothetical protein n=1 Tax=Shewanella algae TaxID=38313 RepID=UPI00313B7797
MSEILLWVNLIVLFLIGLGLRSYLPSYIKEKAKNLAQKEDIQEITDKVEAIRNVHKSDLELFKGSIQSSLEALERKREVYNDFIKSLGVFIGGRTDKTQKQVFLDCYAALWLWAPDEVIYVVNNFVDLQIQAASGQLSDQSVLKESYAACVIILRNDCGVKTELQSSDYRYVFFGS